MTVSLSRRITALERRYEGPPRGPGDGNGDGGGDDADRLRRRFLSGFCRAIAHIRRREIDSGEVWGYSVETLHNLGPVGLACYIAALRHLEHEDEAEARDVLAGLVEERGLDARPLERLINLAEQLGSSPGSRDV